MTQKIPGTAPGSLILEETYFDGPDMRLYRVQRSAGWIEMPGQPRHRVWMHAKAADVRLRLGDDRFNGTSQRGALSLCPADAPASGAWDQPVDLLALAVSPEFCARVLEGRVWDATPFFHVRDPVLSQILGLLPQDVGTDSPLTRVFLEGLVTALVSHLGRDSLAHGKTAPRYGLTPARLRRVLDFLEDHLADDVSLARLAAEAGVSERHFCTMFGRATGRSPHRFLVERRLDKAKLLLRSNPSDSLTDIAMKVGFKSSAHFSATFRRALGTTPSAFRQDH